MTASPNNTHQHRAERAPGTNERTTITPEDVARTWCASSLLNYCRYMFKRANRQRFIVEPYHVAICELLERVIRGEAQHVIINIPPRFGKTEIVSKLFIGYGLTVNPRANFIEVSYSDKLVLKNSRELNDLMREEFHKALFPECTPKSIGAEYWTTAEGGSLYAVSTGGQITGFGAGIQYDPEQYPDGKMPFSGALIIDDPIKPEDAHSDIVRANANARFDSTIKNRVNNPQVPIIIVMQRLHEDDLCGHLIAKEGRKEEGGKWEVLSLPALTEDSEGGEVSLCPRLFSVADLYEMREADEFLFQTQYQQNPTPREGLLYTNFRTYEAMPIGAGMAKNYTDTADTGADWLCSICYVEHPTGLYVTDVVYTKKPMEYTEGAVALMLTKNNTREAWIESNNGGRGFARNVERNLREMGNRSTAVRWFHQSGNKAARIMSNSATVQNMIFWPTDWAERWPQLANALRGYRKEGRNAHDDAPDVVTGMVEKMTTARGGGGGAFSRLMV